MQKEKRYRDNAALLLEKMNNLEDIYPITLDDETLFETVTSLRFDAKPGEAPPRLDFAPPSKTAPRYDPAPPPPGVGPRPPMGMPPPPPPPGAGAAPLSPRGAPQFAMPTMPPSRDAASPPPRPLSPEPPRAPVAPPRVPPSRFDVSAGSPPPKVPQSRFDANAGEIASRPIAIGGTVPKMPQSRFAVGSPSSPSSAPVSAFAVGPSSPRQESPASSSSPPPPPAPTSAPPMQIPVSAFSTSPPVRQAYPQPAPAPPAPGPPSAPPMQIPISPFASSPPVRLAHPVPAPPPKGAPTSPAPPGPSLASSADILISPRMGRPSLPPASSVLRSSAPATQSVISGARGSTSAFSGPPPRGPPGPSIPMNRSSPNLNTDSMRPFPGGPPPVPGAVPKSAPSGLVRSKSSGDQLNNGYSRIGGPSTPPPGSPGLSRPPAAPRPPGAGAGAGAAAGAAASVTLKILANYGDRKKKIMKEQFSDYMDLRREVCTAFQLGPTAPGVHVEYFDVDFEGMTPSQTLLVLR